VVPMGPPPKWHTPRSTATKFPPCMNATFNCYLSPRVGHPSHGGALGKSQRSWLPAATSSVPFSGSKGSTARSQVDGKLGAFPEGLPSLRLPVVHSESAPSPHTSGANRRLVRASFQDTGYDFRDGEDGTEKQSPRRKAGWGSNDFDMTQLSHTGSRFRWFRRSEMDKPMDRTTPPGLLPVEVPNMESICRESVQTAHAAHGEKVAALAHRRRVKDLEVRRQSRQRAAAWRKSYERKEKELMKRMKAERLEKIKLQQEQQQQLLDQPSSAEEEDDTVPESPPSPSKRLSTKPSALSAKNIMMKRKQQEEKQQKAQRAGLIGRYETLSEEERNELIHVFNMYDIDSSELLDQEELRHALQELGLRGVVAEERREMTSLCHEKARGKEGCDLYEFSADLVPAVRRAYMRRRHDHLKRQLPHCARDFMTGQLVFEHVLSLAKTVLPLELLASGESFQQVNKELMEEVAKLTRAFIQTESQFTAFLDGLMRVAETKQRRDCKQQREIQQKHDLDEKSFREFRSELQSLDRLFSEVDEDGSGTLDPDEVKTLFKDLGVLPKSSSEHHQVMTIISGIDRADFNAFLKLIARIRQMYESREGDDVHLGFKRLSSFVVSDSKGSDEDLVLKPDDIRELLRDVGFIQVAVPDEAIPVLVRQANALEEDCVGRVLQEEDPDGIETFSYQAVRRVCQRVRETSRQQELSRRASSIEACFSNKELQELRWAFDQLDQDGGGSLEKAEVQEAMIMLKMTFKREAHFHAVFRELDVDGNGSLDFVEFLTLVQSAQIGGVLKSETMSVSTLKNLSNTDILLVLDCLGIPWSQCEKLTDEVLLRQTCDLLAIDADAQLKIKCGVSTLGELYNYARERADLFQVSNGQEEMGEYEDY